MTDIERSARDALEAQGFRTPGPKLLEHAKDAIARREEGLPAGTRLHGFDPAELIKTRPN